MGFSLFSLFNRPAAPEAAPEVATIGGEVDAVLEKAASSGLVSPTFALESLIPATAPEVVVTEAPPTPTTLAPVIAASVETAPVTEPASFEKTDETVREIMGRELPFIRDFDTAFSYDYVRPASVVVETAFYHDAVIAPAVDTVPATIIALPEISITAGAASVMSAVEELHKPTGRMVFDRFHNEFIYI